MADVIAKRVRQQKGTSDFGRLGRYILEAKGAEAAILWTRTAEYVLDTAGGGEKVAWSRIANCEADTPAWAIKEVLATQAKNTRARGDKSYHLVIAFPDGERPSREQLEDIEDTVCAAIGLADHQRLSAVHTNTDYLHIHIAINKVHPRSFRNVEPYYDKHRLMAVCDELERKHGLTPTHHGDTPIRRSAGRSGDMEAHTGEESLLRWTRENAGEALREVRDRGAGWQDLHATLARHGLEIRPRGAGLVIGERGGGVSVKASRVDRSLAMKSLTDRWGPYQPPDERTAQVKAQRRYHRKPMHGHAGTERLYAEYQRQREAALEARREARQELRDSHETYIRDLLAWYGEKRAGIKANRRLNKDEKRAAYKELAKHRAEDFAERRRLEAEQRRGIAEANPLPSWPSFLREKASRGDALALAVLRSREQRQGRAEGAVLTAENAEDARHVVFDHLKPQVGRNGHTVYHVRDGGRVVDERGHVRVEEITSGAVFLALALAEDRFHGRALIVDGSDAFRRQVAQLAALRGLAVTFADPALEEERRRAAEAPSPALEAFVGQRNGLRGKISDINYHRAWRSADAGEAVYRGRRRLADGSEVVLMKRGEEILVKAVTSRQAAKASRWRVGQTITMDARGRFVGAARAKAR